MIIGHSSNISDKDKIIKHFKFIYRDKCIWALIDGVWTNIDEKAGTDTRARLMVNDLIKKAYPEIGIYPKSDGTKKQRPVYITYDQLLGKIINGSSRKEYRAIAFKNGYVGGNGWIKTNDIPFTTTQIERDFNPDAEPMPILDKFLLSVARTPERLDDLLQVLSGSLSNNNYGIFTFLIGEAGTGKTTLFNLIEKIIGYDNVAKYSSEAVFGNNDSRFGMSGVKDKSLVWTDEFVEEVSESSCRKIKEITNRQGKVNIEIKNSNTNVVDNIGSWFAVSNHISNFKINDNAFKQRLAVWFIKDNAMTQDDWLELNNRDNQNKIIDYFLVLLVQAYIKYQTNNKGERGSYFKNNDTHKFINRLREDDDIINWINENDNQVDGRNSREVKDLLINNNIVNKIGTHKLGQYLVAEGFKYGLVNMNGTRKKVWRKLKDKDGADNE